MSFPTTGHDPRARDHWVFANVVIGRDGSTTINGRSKGLSSVHDRALFHRIRESADALLIGGSSARIEPYAKTPKPLFILSRQPALPEKIAMNDSAQLLHLDLPAAISHLRIMGFSKILMEAGATLLLTALRYQELDGLYITRTPFSPNENLLDLEVLETLLTEQRFIELEREEKAGEIFSFFARQKY